MRITFRNLLIGALGAAACLLAGTPKLNAQDQPPPQGNFDPEQMRQRMMERMRERFEVTDDSEWRAISERLAKVMEARRAAGGPGGPGGFGGGFMRPPGGPGGPPPQSGGDQPNPGGPPPQGGAGAFPGGPGGPGGPGPGFGPPASPEVQALRKAVDAKASTEELKARIADVKAARAKNQATLQQAQQDLREVLSARQEAVATLLGLLN
jgi:hypothetical protein